MSCVQETALAALARPPQSDLFPRIVVGIDFSRASLAGARWAMEHVARGAEAVLSHVVPFARPSSAEGDEDQSERPPSAAVRPMALALAGGLGGFGATLGVANVRTAVRVGRPSHWLDALAAEVDASLIVVGRRNDANRRRIGEANVVERLTRRTSLPVLVVPEGLVGAPRCVVAAVDEGPGGAEVLAAAAAVAMSHQYLLIVLHVLLPSSGSYDRVIDAGGRRRSRGSVATEPQRLTVSPVVDKAAPWLATLVRAHTPVDGGVSLCVGDPAREIVATGVANGGGLLVVGKRGADESPVGSIGSVARDLLASSPLPVLAIDVSGQPAVPSCT